MYEEVKKHDANRHLLVVFDDDFVAQQQLWDLYHKTHGPCHVGILDSYQIFMCDFKKDFNLKFQLKTKYNWRVQRNMAQGRDPQTGWIQTIRSISI